MKKVLVVFLVACLGFLGTAMQVCAGSRVISLGGTAISADDFAVVVPAEPTQSEKKASEELTGFLKQMTGCDLPEAQPTAAGVTPCREQGACVPKSFIVEEGMRKAHPCLIR